MYICLICTWKRRHVNKKQISRVISHDQGQFRLRLSAKKIFPGKKDHHLSRVNFSDWVLTVYSLCFETTALKQRTCMLWLKRLITTFTSNGKREFVPRDQVSPLLAVYCSLFLHKLVVSCNFLSIRIVLSCFYLLIFYFEKFSTWIWRLPFAEYVKHEFSIVSFWPSWPGQECDPSSRPNLFLSLKRFATGHKKMYEKLARVGGWSFHLGQLLLVNTGP